MSNQDKHITPWSASDVQKYLKGELTAREMHQLERAALEDPFLAEAIEGLSQRPSLPLANDLAELQTRLDARVSRKKTSIAWMKIAAAIVLLTGLGFTAWYILLDRPKSNLAQFAPRQTQSAPTQSAPSRAPAGSTTAAARQAPPASGVTARPQINAPAADSAATLSIAKASKHKTKSFTPTFEPVANAVASRSTADTAYLNARVASVDFRRPPASNNFAAGYQRQNLVYSGQVLDLSNRPLAGAALLVSGPSNAITTTNAFGQFKLNLRPQDTVQQLTVAKIGYLNANLAVNKLNSDQMTGNTIILREQPSALNEIVVSGADRRTKETFAAAPFEDKTEKLDSFWVRVAPVTGRLAYLDYLAMAKRTLPVDTTVQGAEVISFAIDPKGTPTDFKIEHSLSPAHDAGVIRLITDGARWKIIHGKNIRAMVHVSFP